MILVTVGAQVPFDRLVAAVDAWAAGRGDVDVVAQVGASKLVPRRLRARAFVAPAELRELTESAELVVAHAGVGSIISALECGVPILVLPRRAELREHRNDHQVDTARRFAGTPGVEVAFDEVELTRKLDDFRAGGRRPPIRRVASPELIDALRTFVAREGRVRGAVAS